MKLIATRNLNPKRYLLKKIFNRLERLSGLTLKIMIWNKQFKYPNSQRSIKGEYDISKMLLPSVTTVLNATHPEDKRKSLDKWARRVGEDEATRIKELAGRRGTAMHFFLQNSFLLVISHL